MLIKTGALGNEEILLLAHVLKKPKEFIIARDRINVGTAQLRRYNKLKLLLAKGWPLAYLVGEKWFCGSKFRVNKNVLIPRPETEMLVELAAEFAVRHSPQIILDIGTGCGAIIVSVKKLFSKMSALRLSARKPAFIGSDISSKALNIARQNAASILGKNHGIKFVRASLLAGLENLCKNKDKIMIIANLPYLSKEQAWAENIKKEPKQALYGGKKPYGKIVMLIQQASALPAQKIAMFLEINYNQAKILQKKIKKLMPESKTEIYKDLAGHNRIIKITSF